MDTYILLEDVLVPMIVTTPRTVCSMRFSTMMGPSAHLLQQLQSQPIGHLDNWKRPEVRCTSLVDKMTVQRRSRLYTMPLLLAMARYLLGRQPAALSAIPAVEVPLPGLC